MAFKAEFGMELLMARRRVVMRRSKMDFLLEASRELRPSITRTRIAARLRVSILRGSSAIGSLRCPEAIGKGIRQPV